MGTFLHRHKRVTPYLLLAPGILWLGLFFLWPMYYLGYESLQSGIFPSFHFSWAFSNYSDALSGYHVQLVRSFVYAGIATVACLVLAYPLAYWIAFRAGPWRNLFLLFIVAPFFVTYLMRTLAWLNILADQGPVVGALRAQLYHVLGRAIQAAGELQEDKRHGQLNLFGEFAGNGDSGAAASDALCPTVKAVMVLTSRHPPSTIQINPSTNNRWSAPSRM